MIRYIFLILFVAVVGFAGWIFSQKFISRDVVVEPVVIDTALSVVLGTVTVNADYATEIRAGEAGRLLDVLIEEGDEVVEGDIVAKIDRRDLELELEAQQIDLDTALRARELPNPREFDVEIAQENLDEVKRLFDLGQRSERQVNASERSLRKAEGDLEISNLNADTNIKRLQNGIQVMNRRLEKMNIRSSIDGIIEDVITEKGDLIGSGAPIASIISKKRVVVAEVSEEQFAGIRTGQKAIVRFLSLGGQLYDAEVTKIFPSADPETQRYSVQLQVDISQDLLVPGLTGEVTITVGERANAKIIPTRALVGDYVFVVVDGRLDFRQIVYGFRSLTQVEILEGLEEGDLVVTVGLDELRPGDPVTIVDEDDRLKIR